MQLEIEKRIKKVLTGNDRFVKITLAVGRIRTTEGVTGRQREAAGIGGEDAGKAMLKKMNEMMKIS